MNLMWKIKHLITKEDIFKLFIYFQECKPRYSGLDTETSGLHIILDSPFLISFGWYNPTTKQAEAFTYDLRTNIDLNEYFFKVLYILLEKTKRLIFWNAKFDLHMLNNSGFPYPGNNVTDALLYVRLAHDALPKTKGGVSSKLKEYATKHIDSNAKYYLNKIESYQTVLRSQRTQLIKKAGFKMKDIEEILRDNISDLEDLPKQVQEIYKTAINPDDYRNIPNEILYQYAAYDVIYTLEAHYKTLPIVKERKQESIIIQEEKLIYNLWEMERVGFKLNKDYALQAKKSLKKYIISLREKLNTLFGEPVKAGQHKKIKELFLVKFNLRLDSSDSKTMKILLNDYNPGIYEIADTIIKLRTLEKWYSTYILKWTKDMYKTDRIYTSINQAGAVSGRVTSDFQQFPKEAIVDENNNEIFHPRKLIKISGEEFDSIIYFDYSQIELRIQAIYTIYVMGGDLNLCRAFMPFKCKNSEGVEFNYITHPNFEDTKWYKEDNVEWSPTDLHTATTLKAFPNLIVGTAEFDKYRAYGKSTNFACNYGSTAKGLQHEFGYSIDLANTLYNAYLNSFPGVAKYRKYVRDFLFKFPYVENLFGRRYYGVTSHEGSSYLVQGSAADLLKRKINEVCNFLKQNNLKTKFQMNIHDEVSFELHKDEHWIIPKIKEIMNNLPQSPVPIKVGIEITHTTWDEAKRYPI